MGLAVRRENFLDGVLRASGDTRNRLFIIDRNCVVFYDGIAAFQVFAAYIGVGNAECEITGHACTIRFFFDRNGAHFYRVGKFQLQAGQLCGVSYIRLGIGAEYDGAIGGRLFAILSVIIIGVSRPVRVVALRSNRFFRSAIIRGVALLPHQVLLIGRHRCPVSVLRNRLIIFVDGPAGIVQGGVGILGNGDVAAAAELIFKGDRFAVF